MGLTSVANAESFFCGGTGKYAAIGTMVPVTLEWNNPKVPNNKVLMVQGDTTVTFTLDKSNSGRSHFAVIDVVKMANSTYTATSAKGSIYDMVFLTESNGTQVSLVACLPNPIVIQ